MNANFLVAGLWGLVIFVSWIGWGTAVVYMARLRRAAAISWPQRAGWGMAMTIAVSGQLLWFHAALPAAFLCMVIVGVAIALMEAIHRKGKGVRMKLRLYRRDQPLGYCVSIALVLVGGFFYLSAVWWPGFNYFDDWPTYLVFVNRLIETGTIIEPFNWRRLSTYGGQQMLQVPIVMITGPYSVHIVDMGLANLINLGLLWTMMRGRSLKRRLGFLAIAILFLLIPMPRVNTQAQCTIVALLMTLFVTLWRRSSREQNIKMAAIAGMVGAALCSFRMNMILVVVLVVVLVYGWRIWRHRAECRIHAAALLVAGAVALFILAPYSWALYESSHSFLFPLMRGTLQEAYQLTYIELPWRTHMKQLLAFFMMPQTLFLTLPILLAMGKRRMRPVIPLYVASIIGTAATVWIFSRSDPANSLRLTFYLMYASALVALALWFRNVRPWLGWAVGLVFLVALFVPWASLSISRLADQAASIRVGLTSNDEQIVIVPDKAIAYNEAQLCVPAGEAFAAATSMPLFFDYTRNIIFNLDSPGTASLDPGMPLDRGAEGIRAYFLHAGIHYLIVVDFDLDPGLYNRPHFLNVAQHPQKYSLLDQASCRPLLLFANAVDSLLKTDEVIYDEKRLRVIHLRTPEEDPLHSVPAH